jgi:hypothetical protein
MQSMKVMIAAAALAMFGVSAGQAAEASVSPAEGLRAAAAKIAEADGRLAVPSNEPRIQLAQKRSGGGAKKFSGGGGKHHHRGRKNNIGKGIAIGAAAAILLGAAASSAQAGRGGYGGRCERLLDRCDYGERWACRKFDRECTD